jgi:CRP-like cAMP-binding protein
MILIDNADKHDISYRDRSQARVQNGVMGMMPVRRPSAAQNRLLSALPADIYDRLRPYLLPVTLSLGEIVCECGRRPEYAYFPAGAVVSLLYIMANGATAEVGMTGHEGVVGIALFLGGDTTPNRSVVQVAGGAFRLRARILQDEFARGGPLQRLLLRYTQEFLTQISQNAVCNRLHAVEKRLCRWLLLSHDRAQSEHLAMTQEFIANMLGARRESVTIAAARLQDAGLIHYSRGNITLLNRTGLEAAACECYRIVRDECDRLLGSPAAR